MARLYSLVQCGIDRSLLIERNNPYIILPALVKSSLASKTTQLSKIEAEGAII